MSYGISPKLPLMKDSKDGYALNKDYISMVKQNIKMVVLTSPGERIMEPTFGVGLRNYLFEPATELTYEKIKTRIKEQLSFYMPFVTIRNIIISEIPAGSSSDALSNFVSIKLDFSIDPLELSASLEIKESVN